METDSKPKQELSSEYQVFWKIRGGNARMFDIQPRPTLPLELEAAQERAIRLLGLINNDDFANIRQNLVSLAGDWMRAGMLTEGQHMEIIRTYEVVTQGKSTEDFLASIQQ